MLSSKWFYTKIMNVYCIPPPPPAKLHCQAQKLLHVEFNIFFPCKAVYQHKEF
jgi:hypothetical protein